MLLCVFWILQTSKRVNPPKSGSGKFARLSKFPIHNMMGNKKEILRNRYIIREIEKKDREFRADILEV